MGLYDVFTDTIKCPHCGEQVELSFQTKELNQSMQSFEPGDKVKITDNLTVSGRIEGVKARHKCRAINKSDMLGILESASYHVRNGEYEDAEKEVRDFRHDIHDPVSILADAVIQDGVFQGLENVRLNPSKEDINNEN